MWVSLGRMGLESSWKTPVMNKHAQCVCVHKKGLPVGHLGEAFHWGPQRDGGPRLLPTLRQSASEKGLLQK